MVLRIKNFNIIAVHWKIQFLWGGEGVHKKPIYRGDLPEKGGLGQFADLRGESCWKIGGGVFEERVDIPMHTIRVVGGGGQGDSVKEWWTSHKNLSSGKYLHKILYQQATTNPTKIMEPKGVP